MLYTEDYVYVVCGSMAKWRDRKTPCSTAIFSSLLLLHRARVGEVPI